MAALYVSTVFARLPIGINGIALVLFLRAEGASFGVAGAAAGGLALGSGLGAPVAARLVDRFCVRVMLALRRSLYERLVHPVVLASIGYGVGPGLVLAIAAALGLLYDGSNELVQMIDAGWRQSLPANRPQTLPRASDARSTQTRPLRAFLSGIHDGPRLRRRSSPCALRFFGDLQP